jgi:hypothetical protein
MFPGVSWFWAWTGGLTGVRGALSPRALTRPSSMWPGESAGLAEVPSPDRAQGVDRYPLRGRQLDECSGIHPDERLSPRSGITMGEPFRPGISAATVVNHLDYAGFRVGTGSPHLRVPEYGGILNSRIMGTIRRTVAAACCAWVLPGTALAQPLAAPPQRLSATRSTTQPYLACPPPLRPAQASKAGGVSAPARAHVRSL